MGPEAKGVEPKAVGGRRSTAGRQAEGTAAQHGGRKAGHDWLCLDVEVAVHFVRPPAAQQTDAIAIDARAKEGHGTAGAGGAYRHIGGGVGGVWVQGESDANAKDAPAYVANLSAMLQRLRADLNAPDMILLLGVNTRFGNGKNAFMPKK